MSTESATYSPGSTEMDVDGDTVSDPDVDGGTVSETDADGGTVSETDAVVDGDRLGLETTERVPSTQKPALPQTPE